MQTRSQFRGNQISDLISFSQNCICSTIAYWVGFRSHGYIFYCLVSVAVKQIAQSFWKIKFHHKSVGQIQSFGFRVYSFICKDDYKLKFIIYSSPLLQDDSNI